MMWIRVLAAALLLELLQWTPGAVAAESAGPAIASCTDNAGCELHMKQGKQAHNEKQYEQALRSYATAYALVPDPVLLVLMGRSHFKQGGYRRALELYRIALPRLGAEADVRKLHEYIREAEQALVGELAAAPAPPAEPPVTGDPASTKSESGAGESPPDSADASPPPPVATPAPLPAPLPTLAAPTPPRPPVVARSPGRSKRAWLWAGVGVLSAAAIATVLGVSLAVYARPPDWPDATTLTPIR